MLFRKKKRHTIKTQVVVDKSIKNLSVKQDNGKKHDFRLFKESKTYIHTNTKIQVDTGYPGIVKKHLNVDIPKKKNKKNPLTKMINLTTE
ncbi:MAG: transposase family protein [Chitinophagales bacterium]